MKRLIVCISALLLTSAVVLSQETSDAQPTSAPLPFAFNTGHYLWFNIGGGLGQIGYDVMGGNTTFYMPSATAGINYTYYFLPWFGLGTGVDIAYYSSQANLTRQMEWEGVTDSEGDSYTHRVDFQNWRERQDELMLEIPLMLSFRTTPKKGSFYFNIGAKAGIPVYANYVHDRGNLIHSGYYKKWDVVLSGLEGRFETEELQRSQEGSIYNKLQKINAACFGELGATIKMDETTDFTLGIYANYYITNHSAVKEGTGTDLGFRNPEHHTEFMNEYAGLVGTKHIGAMHPWSAGIKIGIQTHIITLKERREARAKQLALEQQQQALWSSMHKDTVYIHDTLLVTDTLFVRDTLYMTVHDTIVNAEAKRDTTWIIRIDTICPDPQHPGKFINITEDRLRREDEALYEKQQREGVKPVVVTEKGKRGAKKLDGKLTPSVIWFHFDDYKPILEPFDVIDTVAQALKNNPDMHVYVNGHACKIGSDSYNQRLAMRRANAVARLLRLKGVPAKQITVRSLGANEPYRYNGERHQYSKDRRVEIVPAGADESVEEKTEQDANTAPHKQRTDINYHKYTKFIGEETVRPGSRLAQIARRRYGHQEYWVYIYEANADKIKDPSLIHPGLVVMLPDLTETNAGLTEREALKKAQGLEEKYKQ